MNELLGRKCPPGKRCEGFVGWVVKKGFACRRELLCEGKAEERKVWMGRWRLSAEAVVHGAMRQDGAETVTVKLEIGILKTVD